MGDLDIRLNRKFYEKTDAVFRHAYEYKSRLYRSRTFLKSATDYSKKDLKDKLTLLAKNPKPRDLIFLMRNLLNSGVWIGQSSLRYLVSLVDFTYKGDFEELTPRELSIIKKVNAGESVEDESDEEIFRIIYNEMEYSHYYPEHKNLFNVPSVDCTMVLIPGVFNELFSTSAFERAAQHLEDKYGIKYFAPKVNGFKSSKHNAKLINKQLTEYIKKNPNEKLWLLCFSKGGIDTLHYLADNNDFARKYILGLSTIASPILGSDHLNHKVFKFLNGVHNFSDTKIYRLLNDKGDVMAKEFQKSISSTFQRPWLRRNHDKLPQDLFYTALGFESEWFESHIWMALAKALFKSNLKNDGVVDAENSLFPYYFKPGINLGIMRGHHLVGTRSSYFCQEALIESLLVFLNYKKLIS